MPSPFPGMDPYLESPVHWPDVHLGLISQIQAQLNQSLRPHYHVRVEERVYVSDETDPGRKAIIPDLQVVAGHSYSTFRSNYGQAGTVVCEPVVLTTLVEDEIHEARLEIIDANRQAVVTVIEILSPTNKIVGSRGRVSYEQKRKEVMTSSTHLVEIDLLRDGDHLYCRELLPEADYYVHVSRRGDRPRGTVWPILLPQRLPVILIPLKPEDSDVELDLQTVLNTAYDRAAYDMVVDYRAEPVPPLTGPSVEWADGILRAKGKRAS